MLFRSFFPVVFILVEIKSVFLLYTEYIVKLEEMALPLMCRLFNIDAAPAQAGYEYIAVLVTVVNRTKNQTFNIGAQNLAEINAAYPVPPQENVDANFHALAAASTDFSASCDGQSVECGANISLYNSNSQTFSDSTNLPPQGTGYLQLMLMVPKGWQQLSVTYMPTFAADKTMTFVMTAADVTRA